MSGLVLVAMLAAAITANLAREDGMKGSTATGMVVVESPSLSNWRPPKVYSTGPESGENPETQSPPPAVALPDHIISAATSGLFDAARAVPPSLIAPAVPTTTAVEPTVVAASATPFPASGGAGCPAVVIEVFGEQADAACAVSFCESRWDPGATGDSGRSLGLFQLWTGWAAWYGVPVEALYDATTNTLVAKAVYEYRGHWSGQGGWTCAGLLGIW